MPATATNDAAARRDRSIRLAVGTSLVSKAATVLLQLISIPIAVRVLGREEFGLYTSVNLTLSTVSLLEIGIGPALAHGLSRARASGDEKAQRELGSTAFFLMAGIALSVGVVLAAVLAAVPLAGIYGDAFSGAESSLRPALWVGLVLLILLFVLNLTERIREGFLEVAANNLWGAAGNVAAAAVVAGGVWFFPEVWFLVLAVHGSLMVAKIANTLAMWRKHRLMMPVPGAFRPGLAKYLVGDGVSFSTCFLLTGVIEYNLGGWLVGRMGGGPEAVALYGVFITLTILQLGFVMMLSTPTWPAVAEALARGDLAWAQGAARRLYVYGMGFALCSATGMILLGPWALGIWLGDEFSGTTRVAMGCYSLYFIAHVWRHLNHMMMIGAGRVKKLAVIQSVESLLVAGVMGMALRYGSLEVMLVAMAAGVFAITGWTLPREVWKVLGKRRSSGGEGD